MRDLNILMTGAGAPGAPGIIRCYRNNGERNIKICGVDIKDRIPTIKMLDNFERIPAAQDPQFLPRLLELARQYKIDVIQPLVTRELEVLAQNISLFDDSGIKVCVSPIEQLKIANNKGKMLSVLKEAGIRTPEFLIIHRAEEFEDACRCMGYPQKAVCFKPTKANGSRGFRVIDPKADQGRLLFEEKPSSVYMQLETAKDILRGMETIPELLVMEYMPGVEYSIDMLMDRGKVLYNIPRKRIRMTGGISTVCTVEEEKNIMEYCSEVGTVLNLHGNIGVQVREDAEGNYKILEINPRVQGSIVACLAAGINLPYFGIKLALGEPIDCLPIRWGTEMIRYWNEVYYDASGYAFAY